MSGAYTDVSIDLETLGTAPGSVITQIGLAAFNAEDAQTPTSGILIRVDPQSAIDAGLTIQWDTITWWLQQSDAARVCMAASDGRPLGEALDRMTIWFADECAPDFHVWGHGATFDVGLLECAFAKLNRRPPWGYRSIRDLRTLASLVDDPLIRPQPEVEHNAMHDAMAQAHWINRLMLRVRRATRPLPAAQWAR